MGWKEARRPDRLLDGGGDLRQAGDLRLRAADGGRERGLLLGLRPGDDRAHVGVARGAHASSPTARRAQRSGCSGARPTTRTSSASSTPHRAPRPTTASRRSTASRPRTTTSIRCDTSRDLVVVEVDGVPVAYSRVYWDQPRTAHCVLWQRLLRRSGCRWARRRLRPVHLERGPAARDRCGARCSREGLRGLGQRSKRGRDGAHLPAATSRARTPPRWCGLGRRPPRPRASGRRRDPTRSRRGPSRDLGGGRRGLPRSLGLRRADGGGLRAISRVPLQRHDALEGRLGRGRRGWAPPRHCRRFRPTGVLYTLRVRPGDCCSLRTRHSAASRESLSPKISSTAGSASRTLRTRR